MNLINKKVYHQQFGNGIVTEQTTSTVTVQFSEEYGEKKFLYPSAFEMFLTLNSPALREKMEAELCKMYKRLEDERRQREEEAKQRQVEDRLALLEQKRATAKKRSSPKKTPAKPKDQSKDEKAVKEDTDK